MTGNQRLRQTLNRLPRPRAKTTPLNLKPTTAFEVALSKEIEHVRADVTRIQTRVNWLLGLIVAAALADTLLTVLK